MPTKCRHSMEWKWSFPVLERCVCLCHPASSPVVEGIRRPDQGTMQQHKPLSRTQCPLYPSQLCLFTRDIVLKEWWQFTVTWVNIYLQWPLLLHTQPLYWRKSRQLLTFSASNLANEFSVPWQRNPTPYQYINRAPV